MAATTKLAATWIRNLSSGPSARSSHGVSAGVLGGKIGVFVFGGEEKARHTIDNKLWALTLPSSTPTDKDLQSATWEVFDDGTGECAPEARLGHAQAIVSEGTNPGLYVYGGRTGITMKEGALDDLWRHDGHAWSKVEPTAGSSAGPSLRSFHRAAAVGRYFYVFGGCDGSAGSHERLADLWQFDCDTREWAQLSAPTGLRGRGGATFEASIGTVGAAASSTLCMIAGFA